MKKKQLKLLLYILFIIIFVLIIYKLTLKRYVLEYEKDGYKITEKYYKENKKEYYDIVIEKKNLKYTYTLSEKFNKNKKIISSIKYYKQGNAECIMPEYIKEKNSKIYCKINKEQVSDYIAIKDENVKKIIKKNKLKIDLKKSEDLNKKYKKINIFYKNIEDEIVTVWDYKGIYIIKNNKEEYVKILDYDMYENIQSIIVKDSFILFENSKVLGIKKIYIYNLERNKMKVIEPKIVMSKNTYINGKVGNKIYLTDLDKKVEYAFDFKKKKIEQVSSYNEFIRFTNGKKEVLTKSDFLMNKQFFDNEKIKNKKITNSEELINEKGIYYYIENGKMYMKKENMNKVLLFELANIKEWKVYDDSINLVAEDSLYIYDNKWGLRKIISSKELKYNYKNICKINN